ncbi:MAG TPA: ABC transporter ATP-binding protein [Candidatus Acidoferrales bacterium]|nr:ABC transporter ATP-binding protein [Candidatus Acidoferrales bacterium]
MNNQDLLSVNLNVSYGARSVLQEMTFSLESGEILGLVGHSGCGKSSLAFALLGLLEFKGGQASGSILWDGTDLLTRTERQWMTIRGKEIALVPQSPLSSLNPALRLGTQLNEAWKLHSKDRELGERAIADALEAVSLPATREFLRRFPAEISVGQAQRVLIAMAILHRPRLLIADEPTSALDAITQSEILALFADLNKHLGMATLFISHDLLSVYSLCHRVALLHDGRIVECNTPKEIFLHPRHPFTRKLIAALPFPLAVASEIDESPVLF